jgi:GTP-binding protein
MTRHRTPRPHKDDPIPASARAAFHARPIVAVVGRPNVGKSTLFNRLAGGKIAIVHDQPGVTRDRNYADAFSRGVEYTLVDTGGFDPDSDDPMRQGIVRHVRAALEEADVIVCVLDATVDVTSADREAVKLLRGAKKPVVYAANKADSPTVDALAFDAYRLGLPKIFPVSALHGRGIGELEEAIVDALPELGDGADDPLAAIGDDVPRIALIGRPNAGKSSLLNRLVGKERSLVDARPGTTRDAVDALVTVTRKTENGPVEQPLVVIDTAGIRKKAKVEEAVESVSVLRAIRAIERAEVVVLMCDGIEGVAEQDAKILGLAVDRGRAVVIAINKCDELDQKAQAKAEEAARQKLSFVPWAPIVRMSVKTGRGVGTLIETVANTRAAWVKRVTTGELNRFFTSVLETHPPPTMGGRAVRLYFVTQAESRPPTFVVVTNAPENVHFSYQRYVMNQIRKTFGFEGTPIKIRYKEKRRRKKGEAAPRAAEADVEGDEEVVD